ncbi:MAG: response regulator transcription factor [Candidatus Nanopelagicales bacterium]|nr:response regulator transcription factor [Candidatus Nanopelagicales bacterium]MCF8539587.1 response regulator transcription factor [Candidatus Nanopelagicales bacterium]MCF8550870.1 response regulator transcription factor [Candidatus Nanopelagicales bacterium]
MDLEHASNGQSPRVLVIDDNEDIRNLIAFLLGKEGYTVTQATDGDEGLLEAINTKPDLILLDVIMPRVSGLETLTALRAHKDKSVATIKVIMITANSRAEDVDEALARGANSYIVKPFRPPGLITRVQSVINEE